MALLFDQLRYSEAALDAHLRYVIPDHIVRIEQIALVVR